MFEWITSPEAWIALGTLTALEIVLGIDNIIFISILVSRLPENQRNLGRRVGLSLAMLARLVLLFSIVWVMGLTEPWFTVFAREISGRDVILILGGLFLLGKSTHEIHASLEGVTKSEHKTATATLWSVLLQIAVLDIVFSLDSVITAVGLAKHISICRGCPLSSPSGLCCWLQKHRSFRRCPSNHQDSGAVVSDLVGVTLIVEGFDVHVPKGYIYFAMAFSVLVEMLNIRMRKKRTAPVKLHKQVH